MAQWLTGHSNSGTVAVHLFLYGVFNLVNSSLHILSIYNSQNCEHADQPDFQETKIYSPLDSHLDMLQQ